LGNITVFNEIGLRNINVQCESVSALCWTGINEFTIGDVHGGLISHDLRMDNVTHHGLFHQDTVVGMAMSPDATQMITGGNGQLVYIWDLRKRNAPLFTLTQHKSAVRAMSFSANKRIVATGGGREDGQICFHSTYTGQLLNRIETNDQVCALHWSKNYHELFSAQATQQLNIYDLDEETPKLVKKLSGHDSRPMYLAPSPDGQTIATMGGDEVLKFWKCFEVRNRPIIARKLDFSISETIR
jgi:WD40 repeat protein